VPPYQFPTFHANEGSQLYIFPNPFDHAQLRHFPPPTRLVPIVGHDHTPQPTPISSTHPQLPFKVLCSICRCQFISRGLICHKHSYHTSNSSNLNPCDHPSLIPSFTLTSPSLAWTWVSTLDVIKSFHLDLCRLHLYNHIPFTLQCDV